MTYANIIEQWKLWSWSVVVPVKTDSVFVYYAKENRKDWGLWKPDGHLQADSNNWFLKSYMESK
jgi:hypothetical protein